MQLVTRITGWRPSVADWGVVCLSSCKLRVQSLLVRIMGGRYLCCGTTVIASQLPLPRLWSAAGHGLSSVSGAIQVHMILLHSTIKKTQIKKQYIIPVSRSVKGEEIPKSRLTLGLSPLTFITRNQFSKVLCHKLPMTYFRVCNYTSS